MKRRIFVDMDGTLAKWNNVDMPDVLYEKGYFENLEANNNLVQEVRNLIKEGEDIYILSSFLNDSKYALEEKQNWLDKYLPEINYSRRIFVEYGNKKSKSIQNGITFSDFLIDDYTKNLLDWKEAGGTGIKFLNGINHTKGTWQGFLLKNDEEIENSLKQIINLNNDEKQMFNEHYLELHKIYNDSIYKYMNSIDLPIEDLLNAESQMRESKNNLLAERKRLSELFKIEVASKWMEDEDLVVHYKIYTKNGKLLYDGYNYISDTRTMLPDNKIFNHIYSFKVDNKIDIIKTSKYLQSFVREILSTNTEISVSLYEDELMDMWDMNKYELKDKYEDIMKEIIDYGLSNSIKINRYGNGFINEIDINPTIIHEFDFTNEDYNQTHSSVEIEKSEEDYELEYE